MAEQVGEGRNGEKKTLLVRSFPRMSQDGQVPRHGVSRQDADHLGCIDITGASTTTGWNQGGG